MSDRQASRRGEDDRRTGHGPESAPEAGLEREDAQPDRGSRRSCRGTAR